jgi:outer membrane protein assembly factor BamB
VYSSPTIVDLDHDGKLEIIIGTSVGFLYVLDHLGHLRPGWPKQMGDIQAQVAVADVNGDGYLELLALDSRGSAAMFNVNGTLLWDQHVRSPLSQAASFGDINGDGRLEAVFGAASGEVFAFDAVSGVCPCCMCQLSRYYSTMWEYF